MDNISGKARELIPYLHNQNFKEIFAEFTSGGPNNAQFLLRMELRRLCSPCLRVIDFRADGDTEMFTYNGISHFLQKDDIEEFNSQLAYYDGVYTKGLYEEIVRSHNERKKQKRNEGALQQDPNRPTRYQVEGIRFTSYAHRRDERMFYSSPIKVNFSNGQTIDARTSDLSCSGIKVLLPFALEFHGREKITITFTHLIELYPKAASFLTNVPYETLGIDNKDVRYWLKTRCLSDNKELERFIFSFQNANKYRYRIDIDYMAYTLNIKALEYQYLPKVIGIPLFFAGTENIKLAYALKSDYNHEQLDYWRDEKANDKMNSLFTGDRLNRILSKPEGKQYTYIYTFKHTSDNHIFFLSATLEELQENDLLSTFFSMSKGRSTFRVYRFEINKLNLTEKAINSLINERSADKTEGLAQNLQELSYVGLLTRIDNNNDAEIYSQFQSTKSVNELQRFTHVTSNVEPAKLEYLQYITPRKEQRYIYQTKVGVSNDVFSEVIGFTRDISTHGLQIELPRPVKYYNGDVVYVTLPDFQKLKKSISLTHVPYEVVFINSAHTVMHLQLHGNVYSAVAQFFEELIKANTKILEPAKTVPHMSEMSKILRSLTVSNLFSTPVIFMRSKSSRLGYACESANGIQGQKLLHIVKSEDKHLNLYPLFSNQVLKGCVLPLLQEAKNTDDQKMMTIYVRRHTNEKGISYVPMAESNFKSLAEKQEFIKQGFSNGYFGAFNIYLTATGKPDTSEINTELDYIRRYAPHKFKILESNIWNVMGIGDIIDITESVLIKHGLNIKIGQIPEITDRDIEIAPL